MGSTRPGDVQCVSIVHRQCPDRGTRYAPIDTPGRGTTRNHRRDPTPALQLELGNPSVGRPIRRPQGVSLFLLTRHPDSRKVDFHRRLSRYHRPYVGGTPAGGTVREPRRQSAQVLLGIPVRNSARGPEEALRAITLRLWSNTRPKASRTAISWCSSEDSPLGNGATSRTSTMRSGNRRQARNPTMAFP